MTVQSIDSKTWKTKLNRIGEISAGNREIVFNNLGHLITEEALRELYYQLEPNKAVGADGITKENYGEKLEENLKSLIRRIRKGTYRPKPVRMVEIPKEDGSTRPLAISCLE